MFDPEKYLITNSSSEDNLTAAEEKIFRKLVKDPEIKKPKLEEFVDIYSSQEIGLDAARIERIEGQFETGSTKKSKILEALLINQIELSEWFGGGCHTEETTKYDDYINHTDFVAEWTDDDGHPVRLGVDVTCSDEKADYCKKAENIISELKKGKGTEIKYFQSKEFNFKGRISDIPRVIIAINKEVINDLSRVVALVLENKSSTARHQALKILAACPLQTSIIEEIIKQLDRQIRRLEAQSGKNLPIYSNTEKVLQIMENIFDNKIGSIDDSPSSRDFKATEVNEFFAE